MQINKGNIKAFFEGNIRSMAKKLESILPDSINLFDEETKEQFAYRASICEPCMNNGSCLVCGCKTPGLFLANKGCPAGKYPILLSKEEWKILNYMIAVFVKRLRENPNDEKSRKLIKELWDYKQRIIKYENKIRDRNTKNRPWL